LPLSRRLLLIAFIIIPLIAAEAKTNGESDRHDDPRARAQWLLKHRGGIAPPGARLRAERQRDQLILKSGQSYGAAASGSGFIQGQSPSSSQWLPIGPAPAIEGTNAPFNDWPDSSGRVNALAVDPTDTTGNTVYLGAASGGVWKTTDGGNTWTSLFDTQSSLAIGSIAVDAGGAVYVGTGEENFAQDSYYGAGIFKSTDGGQTWAAVNSGLSLSQRSLGGFPSVGAISVEPGTSGSSAVLLAALYSQQSGIYRSTNGGASWSLVQAAAGTSNTSSPDFGVGAALQVSFASPSVAYATLLGQGVYKSTDSGATWTAINTGIAFTGLTTKSGAQFAGRFSIGVSPHNPNVAYVAVAADPAGDMLGFYVTTNGGANWAPVKFDNAVVTNVYGRLMDFCAYQCWYDLTVAVSPVNENLVLVGGAAEVATGKDGTTQIEGEVMISFNGTATTTANSVTTATPTFVSQLLNGQLVDDKMHVDHHAYAFTPDGNTLYWGNDGGVYKTAGMTASNFAGWTDLNHNLQITQYYPDFVIDPTNVNRTFAGAQDNGNQVYDGTQLIANAWTSLTPCDGASNVIDVNVPQRVFVNCEFVSIFESSTGGATASSFTPIETGAVITDPNIEFIPPMKGDTSNPMKLYFATNRIWQATSADTGVTWSLLETQDLGTNAGNSGAVDNFSISADNSTIYTAADSGAVWKLSNLNGTVATTNLTDSGTVVPLGEYVSAINADPNNANVVYIGLAGFDANQRIFKRDTSGTAGWVNISGNLPTTPVNDLVIDPVLANTIYAATDVGVFVTSDGGTTWTPLANALPDVVVMGLQLQPRTRTLRAVTHGRGAWDLFVPAPPFALPSTLNFGTIPTGNVSPAQSVTYFNNSGSSININSVTASSGFQVTNGCGSTLASGASCTLSVSFAPTVAGPATGTLQVVSSVNSVTVNLSGTGLLVATGAPVFNSLTPLSVVAGSGAFTLTVNGSNFGSNSQVLWNNSTKTTTFVSATQLTASIAATDISNTGKGVVTITNTGTNGGTSNAFDVAINSSSSGSGSFTIALAQTNLTVTHGSSTTTTFTITGPTGTFNYGCYNLPANATCSVSGSTLTITTTSSTPAGTYPVTFVVSTSPIASLNVHPFWALAFIMPFGLMLTRRKRMIVLAVVLVCAAALYTGCGGGGSSSSGTTVTPTVTTASGQQSTVFNLTVN